MERVDGPRELRNNHRFTYSPTTYPVGGDGDSSELCSESGSTNKVKSTLLKCSKMNPGDLTVEVTTLSPRATEEDVYNFFAFCGEIEHIEIIRSSEYDCTAYVTFKDPYAPKTAVLLSGSFIEDQQVGISMMHTSYVDESDPWNMVDGTRSTLTSSEAHAFVSSPGEAVTVAQEVVKTMVAKGYVLGKDALVKAKALDESYKVSSNVAAKVADVSNRMGLTNKINAGIEVAKSIDGKYHVVETTKMAACYTGQTAVAVANSVVRSSYFSRGALWVSEVLNRAAKAAAELANNQGTTTTTVNKV